MAEKVTTEDRGAVRILTINRPDQRNCVDGETAVGIGRAIEAFAAETIASYPNFPGICADRRAVLEGLSRDVDEGIVLEAKVVRPECFSEEMQAGLRRFAGGARDPSPRPPALPPS